MGCQSVTASAESLSPSLSLSWSSSRQTRPFLPSVVRRRYPPESSGDGGGTHYPGGAGDEIAGRGGMVGGAGCYGSVALGPASVGCRGRPSLHAHAWAREAPGGGVQDACLHLGEGSHTWDDYG